MEKSKKVKDHSSNSAHKITQMEERLHRMWDCMLQMSDKITEIKYLIKSLKTK